MADLIREVKRLMNEIASLNSRILDHVYHRAWDRDVLRSMHEELDAKKARLAELRTVNVGPRPAPELAARAPDGGDEMTVHETRLIANALFTQRPLIYESDEWIVYRRVCTSLARLFAYELREQGEFELKEFLVHCGLSLADAERIAANPAEFVRRAEDLPSESPDQNAEV